MSLRPNLTPPQVANARIAGRKCPASVAGLIARVRAISEASSHSTHRVIARLGGSRLARSFEPGSSVSNSGLSRDRADASRKHKTGRQRQGADFASEGCKRAAERPNLRDHYPQPRATAAIVTQAGKYHKIKDLLVGEVGLEPTKA